MELKERFERQCQSESSVTELTMQIEVLQTKVLELENEKEILIQVKNAHDELQKQTREMYEKEKTEMRDLSEATQKEMEESFQVRIDDLSSQVTALQLSLEEYKKLEERLEATMNEKKALEEQLTVLQQKTEEEVIKLNQIINEMTDNASKQEEKVQKIEESSKSEIQSLTDLVTTLKQNSVETKKKAVEKENLYNKIQKELEAEKVKINAVKKELEEAKSCNELLSLENAELHSKCQVDPRRTSLNITEDEMRRQSLNKENVNVVHPGDKRRIDDVSMTPLSKKKTRTSLSSASDSVLKDRTKVNSGSVVGTPSTKKGQCIFFLLLIQSRYCV
jgi:DNA repair exonuclease SbcCD ATPase subunit